MLKDVEISKIHLLVAISTLLLALFVFWDYLVMGNGFISRTFNSDLLRANLPTYIMVYDTLREGPHLWSFNMGLGTTMFSHADVYFDPFTYIIFIGGRDNIAYMMGWAFAAKIVFEALSMSFYLRHFNVDKRMVVIGSLSYAFCGYSLVMGSNLALGTILVYMPLALLCIEKYFEGKWHYFMVIPLILIGITSYYYLYMSAIILFVYTLVRAYELKLSILKAVMWLIFSGIAAVLIIMPIVLPELDMALGSARANSGKDVYFSHILLIPNVLIGFTALARSFDISVLGNNLTGFVGYIPLGDFYQCETFVTCLTVPTILLYLMKKRDSIKRYAIIGTLLFLAVSTPIVSYFFNEFSTTNYRWIFIIHILICLTCAYALTFIARTKYTLKEVSLVTVCSILILFITAAIVADVTTHAPVSIILGHITTYCLVIVLSIAFALAVWLLCGRDSEGVNKKTEMFYAVLLVLVVVNVSVTYYPLYEDDTNIVHFEDSTYGYDDGSSMVISDIQNSDDSFYRIYKDFDSVYDVHGIPSDNDSMAQDYYGLKCYNSMNTASYIRFLQTLGIYVACNPDYITLREEGVDPTSFTGANLNYINGIEDRYELCGYLGVKYLLAEEGSSVALPPQFVYQYTSHGCDVYRNDTANGLGFVNSHYILESDFMELSYVDRIAALVTHTIVKDTSGVVDSAGTQTVNLTSFSQDRLTFDVQVSGGAQYVSFSIPYEKNWHVKVDGVEVSSEEINIALLGVKVSEGSHTIELSYYPASITYGVWMMIGGFCVMVALFWYVPRYCLPRV